MPNVRRLAFYFAAVLMIAAPILAQNSLKGINAAATSPQAEVLVLGSYHMDNPGRDLHDEKADDVLTPKRQAEIEELATVLARFHPTKIAVEWDAGNQSGLDRSYGEYLAGKRELNRNEVQQIGFRLGKEMGLKKLNAIDTMWDFPYGSIVNWAKAHGRSAELEAIDRAGADRSKNASEYLVAHSILEVYRHINSPESMAADAAFYARMGHFGDDEDPAGARLLMRWHERNTFILTSLLEVIEPGDRVLVLYGAGHLTHLSRLIGDDPTLRLRRLEELVGEKR
ncbi:MAG: DUF5694 domain-containing protein [Terriglobales bacterium]|jgi:hypothetical protein